MAANLPRGGGGEPLGPVRWNPQSVRRGGFPGVHGISHCMVGARHHDGPLPAAPSGPPPWLPRSPEEYGDSVWPSRRRLLPGDPSAGPAERGRLGEDGFPSHAEEGRKHGPPILVTLDPHQEDQRAREGPACVRLVARALDPGRVVGDIEDPDASGPLIDLKPSRPVNPCHTPRTASRPGLRSSERSSRLRMARATLAAWCRPGRGELKGETAPDLGLHLEAVPLGGHVQILDLFHRVDGEERRTHVLRLEHEKSPAGPSPVPL